MNSPNKLKIISWNLNHRTIEKPIPNEIAMFFEEYKPDIIALNEYVDGESRNEFKQELTELGYFHQLLSPKVGRQNQIFIASKNEITLGDIHAPDFTDPAKTNFLHVTMEETDLELVGFRAPFYKLASERNAYWKQVSEKIAGVSKRQILFLGDINYDPFKGASNSAPEIEFDLAGSFRIPNPEGEWSFISIDGKNKSRIDHAIVSDGVNVSNVKYLTVYNGITLAGSKSDSAITDHAVLSVDVEI